mgnify:FL=1|jgi:peroxiredoxin
MAQLRQDFDDFRNRNATVIIIGPEDEEAFRSHWEKEGYPFVGIPDPDHRIADRYGQEVRLLKLGRLPALTVVDIDGLVRYTHHGSSMQDIADNAVILDLLDDLNEEHRSAEN